MFLYEISLPYGTEKSRFLGLGGFGREIGTPGLSTAQQTEGLLFRPQSARDLGLAERHPPQILGGARTVNQDLMEEIVQA
jgi:hypothetical protein